MLRLSIYCTLVSSPRHEIKTGKGFGPMFTYQRCRVLRGRIAVRGLKDEMDGGKGGGASGQSWDPGLEIEVPFEQRPVNEYSSLKESTLYSWTELGPGSFFLRLGGLWLATFAVLGVPIAAASFNLSKRQANMAAHSMAMAAYSYASPTVLYYVLSFLARVLLADCTGSGNSSNFWCIYTFSVKLREANTFLTKQDPLRFFLAAGTGTLFLVSLIVLRIYLGWSYVGDRLLSAVIPYEETGWYDGQMWVKPPEILARDRLLGSYKVKPVIKLLKQTLVVTGVLLVTAVSLFIFTTPVEDFIHKTFVQENQSNGSVSNISSKFNIRKEELLRLPVDVKTDDDLGAAAAEGPVYCRDRFYRALAGGRYYKWEDLVK